MEVDTTEAAGFCNRKCNWELFVAAILEQGEELRSAAEGITKAEDADRAAEMLNNAVVKACAKSIPKRKRFKKSVPWWTPELTETRTKVRQTRRRFQQARGEERAAAEATYHEKRAEYKTQLNDTRLAKWKEFCEESTRQDLWGAASKVLLRKRSTAILTTVRGTSRKDRTTGYPPAVKLEEHWRV